MIVAALLLLLVAYLSRQSILLREAEEAHHQEAEEYFKKLDRTLVYLSLASPNAPSTTLIYTHVTDCDI
jgi:hypothetical protein